MGFSSSFVSFDLYSYFYSLVRQIPEGKVSTYMDLALALGDPIAVRAVGRMLSENPDPEGTQCFRVVHSDGSVGKYTHPLGSDEKERRLRASGINVDGGHITDFERKRFSDYKSEYPLKKIANEQKAMAEKLSTEDTDIDTFGAVDVSYSGKLGFAAFVWREGREIAVRFASTRINFPYIPTYLSYREGEIMKRAIGNFSGIVLVDGHGIYHPRYCGLACYIGLTANIATVGVGKSKLRGDLSQNYVRLEGRKVAMINKGKFLSPGNRVNFKTIKRILQNNHSVFSLTDEAHRAATYYKEKAEEQASQEA